MHTYYSAEKSVQIVISLLKAHNIRKVIVSPGTTNITLVASMQYDSFFELYSAADERSAAYIACGLAAESGECVALSCTGATASRNYISGLTEAYYRKLPVLAITSTQNTERVGHLVPQVIDRSQHAADIALFSINIPAIIDDSQVWYCETKINEALLELTRHGGGPVHINLATTYNKDFSVQTLPRYRVIKRITPHDTFPTLSNKKVAVFIGAHRQFSDAELTAIDNFCKKVGAVVLYDHTSCYKGLFGVLSALPFAQVSIENEMIDIDLLIHIGEVSGEYGITRIKPREVWRVSEDGEIKDTFKRLAFVFEMPEQQFFEYYAQNTTQQNCCNLYQMYDNHYSYIYNNIKELPFSNIWMAYKMAPLVPQESILHLGILNSLRSWNFFNIDKSITVYSNVGGFGIDGGISTLLGTALNNKNKLYFGVFGDLAFFYDMNSLGNRHVHSNIRIMLINNGVGTEFKNYSHPAYQFGEDANAFMAAAGHYGNKSPLLVKHYAEDLGFEYLTASNKEEFEATYKRFLSSERYEKPIIFEVFTNSNDESDALYAISHIHMTNQNKLAGAVRNVFGDNTVQFLKKVIKH